MTQSGSAEGRLPAVAPLQVGRASIRAGILWMLLTTLLFVCQDSTARILLASYPPTEIAFARYFVHIGLVAGFLALREPRLLSSRRPLLQMLRSSLLNRLRALLRSSIFPPSSGSRPSSSPLFRF